ncbi:MAG: C10 family peptidase [Bacteroidaceae bacterium]|nr:C10 family peptidase [Bacteroidaceae bacterium]
MKKFLLLTLALVATGMTHAYERTDKQMRNLAAKALSDRATTKRMAKADFADNMREIYADAQLKMFDLPEVGTVVVSCDDAFEPILGVTDRSFSGNYMPDNFYWWLQTTSATLQYRQANGLGDVPELQAATPKNVANFMKTKWSQSAPYNNTCPQTGGQRTLTGCTATAMAQICNYYKYPAKVNGSTGYEYSVVDANGNETPKSSKLWVTQKIDWDNMINDYYNTDYTNAQATAVANLMRDCGYTVHMSYGLDASASSPMDVAGAFTNNLLYDSLQVGTFYREFYSNDEWNDLIYSELAEKHPIFYGGSTNDHEGHAFVLSGMQSNGKVYVNWGWQGEYDGFFTLNYLTCAGMNFSQTSNVIILGMRPEPSPADGNRGRYGCSIWCMNEPTVKVTSAGHLTFACDGIYNYSGSLYFFGNLSLMLENKDDPTVGAALSLLSTEPYEDGSYEVMPPYYGMSLTGRYSIDFMEYFTDIPAGTYLLYMISQASNETREQYARVEGGVMMYEVVIGANGKAQSATRIDPAKAIEIVAADVESIPETIRRPADDDATYDLMGRKVANNTRGLLIRGGKKYFVR